MSAFNGLCGGYNRRLLGNIDLEKLNASWEVPRLQIFQCDGALFDRTAAEKDMLACIAEKFRCQRKSNATVGCAKNQSLPTSVSLEQCITYHQ